MADISSDDFETHKQLRTPQHIAWLLDHFDENGQKTWEYYLSAKIHSPSDIGFFKVSSNTDAVTTLAADG